MISVQPNKTMPMIRIALGFLVVSLTLAFGWAVWTIPSDQTGLRDTVQTEMPRSGVDNPVTAVLLNFRGYDTLLEVGVLVIALLGVWSLPMGASPQGVTTRENPGPIFVAFARLLAPLMVLVAAYLTWVGSYAPGGAFQGAAVLGAVGVLFLLLQGHPARYATSWMPNWGLRVLAGVGFAIFLGVALMGLTSGGRLLEYPRGWTGSLILIIELVLTLSIAIILVGLFPGGPYPNSRGTTGKSGGEETS